MEIKKGKMVECFAVTPTINVSWIKFPDTNVYYLQFAWLFWYINFAYKKSRWKRYYKKVTLSEKDLQKGRCIYCDAGFSYEGFPRCSERNGRPCPCEYNQYLMKKK